MKKLLLNRFFTLLFLISFSGSVIAAVQIVPERPNSSDTVYITLSGEWSSTCVPNTTHTAVLDSNLYFAASPNYPPGINCGPGTTPWELTESFGPFAPGIYTLHIGGSGTKPYKEFIVTEVNNTNINLYVDAVNGDDDNSGFSDSTALATIQAAIDSSIDGDTVLVADGIYTGDGNRDIDFRGKAITLKSLNGPNNCIIDCNGTESEPHRGFHFYNGEDANSILDGFTITNGFIEFGGGIFCEKSSPTLINCTITDNLARGNGSGIYCDQSTLTITNCTFTGNSARMNGGGIYCNQSTPTITKCTFRGNMTNTGGGICNIDGSPIITNCTFEDNRVKGNSGGINSVSGNPVLTSCIFKGNKADRLDGGGMTSGSGNPKLINCIFYGNSSGRNGGGISHYSDGRPSLINCTFNGNSALEHGGALDCGDFTNAILLNCIFWGNIASEGPEISITDWNGEQQATLLISYCDVQEGRDAVYVASTGVLNWSEMNIDRDPCFVNPGYWDPNGTPTEPGDDFWVDGDYHLLPDSLCINAGDPNYIPEPNETDLDGLPRIIAGRIDMGAYEFDSRPVAIAGPNQTAYAFIDGLADVTLDGSASYDNEGDPLDYYWSWFIEPNLYEANGVSPTIFLPVGEHEFELIVNDGIDDSEPNYCTVTVIEPLQTKLWLWPTTLNCNSRPRYVTTFVYLPKGIEPGDVNSQPLTMYPCDIQSKYQRVFRMGHGRYARTVVMAVFDKDQICDCFGPGWHRVEVAGRLQTGRYFYGSNTIRITRPYRHKWPFRRFYNPH